VHGRAFGGSTVRLFARSLEDRKRLGVGIEGFEDLKSWLEARRLTQFVYRMTGGKAFTQDCGLAWQIEEAAIRSSIWMNKSSG